MSPPTSKRTRISSSGEEDYPIAVGKIRLDVPKLAELKTSAKSPVVYIANISWSLEVKSECSMRTSNIKQLPVYVKCNEGNQSTHWSCEASVIFHLLSLKVDLKQPLDERLVDTYNAKQYSWGYMSFLTLDEVLDPENGFIREEDGGVVVEAMIIVRKVIGLPVPTLCDFTAPQPNLTNVALIVEEKPLHMDKSGIFNEENSMFFGDFDEKDRKEIPLKDVDYDEFIELLHVIYPSRKPVTVTTVESLLRLADRFSMPAVLHSCEEFLRGPESEEIPLAKKLRYCDQYRLANLQSICLKSLKSLLDVKALKMTKEFGEFSSKMKDELADWMLDLC